MATEQEELRLTVSLVDNASAGIVALRGQISQLTSGQTASQLERFKRTQEDMGRQIKELTNLAIGGEKAFVGFIGKFGAAGAAAASFATVVGVGLNNLRRFAEHIENISNKARMIGASSAEINHLIKQFERAGLSSQDAIQSVQGLNQAVAEMSRAGSQRFIDLLQHSGRYAQAMREAVEHVLAQQSAEEKLADIRNQAMTIYNNRLEDARRRGENMNSAMADANELARQFLEHWGQSGNLLVEGLANIQKMSKEYADRFAEMERNSQNALSTWRELEHVWGRMFKSLEVGALSPDGVVVQGLEKALWLSQQIESVWAKIRPSPQQGGQGPGGTAGTAPGGIGIPNLLPLIPGAGGVGGLLWLYKQIPRSKGGLGEEQKGYQFGGAVHETGTYMLHKGEEVLPTRDVQQHEKDLKDNTDQLKKLNDMLALLTDDKDKIDLRNRLGPGGAGLGGVGGGIGGGPGGGGGGGGPGGGGGGGGYGGGGGGGGGGLPNGSSVGPGTGAGAGSTPAGVSPARTAGQGFFGEPFSGGVPGGGVLGDMDKTGALTGKAGGFSGGLGPHGVLGAEGLGGAGAFGGPPGAGGAPGAGLKGSAFLQAQRASKMAEINNDPATKKLVGQMLATEAHLGNSASATATLEALVNRSVMTGNSIKDELNSGFYGPIKSGAAQRRVLSQNEQASVDAAIGNVAGGSNLIQSRVNQGSPGDPGAGLPGRVADPSGGREVFNAWEGRRMGRNWSAKQSLDWIAENERQVAQGGGGGGSVGPNSPPPSGTIAASGGDTGYTGTGGFNFMGSARARAMGFGDVTHGGALAQMNFPTGIPAGQGPASIKANKYAGPDMAGFLRDLHEAGAPLNQFAGAYVNKPLQHGYGNALDIETGFGRAGLHGLDSSPALAKWAQEHPDQFAAIQAKHHMANLDVNLGGGKSDWGHFEWSPERRATPEEMSSRASGAGSGLESARSTVDAHRVQTVKVEGSGTLRANISAPRGTDVTMEGGGLFKKTEVTRQTQMAPAREGPPRASAASVPGGGTPL